MELFSYSFQNFMDEFSTCRSSHPEVFCKKGVLRNFPKFTGKYLCQSLFFNKVVGLRPGIFIKKETMAQVFSVNFAKFLSTPFLKELLRWLLLHLAYIISKKVNTQQWRFSIRNRNSRLEVFLKISQNSQENACFRVSFLVKLQTSGLQF